MKTTDFHTIRCRPEWQAGLDRLNLYLRCLQIEDRFLREEIRLQAVARASLDAEKGRRDSGVVQHGIGLVEDWFVCDGKTSNQQAAQRRLKLAVDARSFPVTASLLRDASPTWESEAEEEFAIQPMPQLRVSRMVPQREAAPERAEAEWPVLLWLRRAVAVPTLVATSAALTAVLLFVHF